MSATKRIRYTGHSGTGVDVVYLDPQKGPQRVTVEHGHQLPAEVPASVRDSLLSQEGEWSEVQQGASSSSSADKAKKED